MIGWRYRLGMSIETRRGSRRRDAIAAVALGLAVGLCGANIEPRAQQGTQKGTESSPMEAPKSAPESPPAPLPADPQSPKPEGRRSDGRQSEGRPTERLPATADEKSKLLSDLYAHLATADSPEEAKKAQAAIERLWSHSGSDTVNLLMQRATKALVAKDFDQAMKFMDYVVLLAPDYAEGFNRRAYIHFSRNDMSSALGDLRRALALEPNHFKALDGLAQIWRQMGNSKAALNVVKQLLEVHPYWEGASRMAEELAREVEGQGI
jgi:tetratricopeptide (TPR) repeat protein